MPETNTKLSNDPQTGQQASARQKLLEVRNLRMWFPRRSGLFGRNVSYVKAVDGVSFYIRQGETLGLVGESGCGKTTVGRCIMRVYEPTGGEIVYYDSPAPQPESQHSTEPKEPDAVDLVTDRTELKSYRRKSA
jgi:ABC-type oligopeptide transport system ATPase subunit